MLAFPMVVLHGICTQLLLTAMQFHLKPGPKLISCLIKKLGMHTYCLMIYNYLEQKPLTISSPSLLPITQRSLDGHVGDVYTCRLFPSGVVVLSAGADLRLRIWSAQDGSCARTLLGHTRGMLCLQCTLSVLL